MSTSIHSYTWTWHNTQEYFQIQVSSFHGLYLYATKDNKHLDWMNDTKMRLINKAVISQLIDICPYGVPLHLVDWMKLLSALVKYLSTIQVIKIAPPIHETCLLWSMRYQKVEILTLHMVHCRADGCRSNFLLPDRKCLVFGSQLHISHCSRSNLV